MAGIAVAVVCDRRVRAASGIGPSGHRCGVRLLLLCVGLITATAAFAFVTSRRVKLGERCDKTCASRHGGGVLGISGHRNFFEGRAPSSTRPTRNGGDPTVAAERHLIPARAQRHLLRGLRPQRATLGQRLVSRGRHCHRLAVERPAELGLRMALELKLQLGWRGHVDPRRAIPHLPATAEDRARVQIGDTRRLPAPGARVVPVVANHLAREV